MGRDKIVSTIIREGVVAIVRLEKASQVIPVVDALQKAPLRCIEITTNTPGCFQKIEEVKNRFPDLLVGVGTVINEKLAKEAIKAGAQFLVTPNTYQAVVDVAHQHDIPVIMGAFSPTEIHMAAAFGADMVKLFPANFFPNEYMKAVRATLPEIPMVPTGGINLENISSWFAAGADALGVGSTITNKQYILEENYDLITACAKQFISQVKKARESKNHPQ